MLNKPPGMNVHTEGETQGLVVKLAEALGQPLWLVHRLDKLTSGVLVLATDQSAASELSQAFQTREVDKLYLALSREKPKRKQGRIRGDMQRGRSGNWLLRRSTDNPAVTEFMVKSAGEGLRLILCHPLTGKTHQIRVALKSEGAPILGDTRYAGVVNPSDRGYLHAWQLGFSFRGQTYVFRCDPTEGELFQLPALKDLMAQFANCDNWPAHWQLPQLLNKKAERIDV